MRKCYSRKNHRVTYPDIIIIIIIINNNTDRRSIKNNIEGLGQRERKRGRAFYIQDHKFFQ